VRSRFSTKVLIWGESRSLGMSELQKTCSHHLPSSILRPWRCLWCHRPRHSVDFCGLTLAWFRSYLQDCYQFVHINEEISDQAQVKYGVPQASVLGPLLFSLCMLLLRKHGINFHGDADNTQILYFLRNASDQKMLEYNWLFDGCTIALSSTVKHLCVIAWYQNVFGLSNC